MKVKVGSLWSVRILALEAGMSWQISLSKEQSRSFLRCFQMISLSLSCWGGVGTSGAFSGEVEVWAWKCFERGGGGMAVRTAIKQFGIKLGEASCSTQRELINNSGQRYLCLTQRETLSLGPSIQRITKVNWFKKSGNLNLTFINCS